MKTFHDLMSPTTINKENVYLVTTKEIELNIKARKLTFFKTSPFKLLDYNIQELAVDKVTSLRECRILAFRALLLNTFNTEQWKTFTIPITHLEKGIYVDKPTESLSYYENVKEIKYYAVGINNYVMTLASINNKNKKTLKEYIDYLNSIGLQNYALTEKYKYETQLKQQLRKILTNIWKQKLLKINS